MKLFPDREKKLQLYIKRVVEVGRTREGVRIVKTRWERADEVVNLGSIKEPNESIEEFAYEEE